MTLWPGYCQIAFSAKQAAMPSQSLAARAV
jgi:hypothetical protein